MVREARQGIEAEHGARPLQGVQSAEHRIDQVGVAEAITQVEQPLFDLVEQFARLHAESGDRIVGTHRPSTFFATFTS